MERSKKGLDIWLNDKGLYRKHIAMDETCLFRAVSDQIHSTQIYHEQFRKQCLQFARDNFQFFKDFFGDLDLNEHLNNLETHFVVCGNVEIQILSKMLKRDFIVIKSQTLKTENVTNNGYEKVITLCLMRDGHFDSIWAKGKIENSAYCQSLVYKLLYENVFGMENIDNIVSGMLYPEEESSKTQSLCLLDFLPEDDKESNAAPPFPYKVAKALDPTQYRNIEFDAWNQSRKECRLKDWYMGGDDFKVGTKCLVEVQANDYECYIQDLNHDGQSDLCLVYVILLAQKIVVTREELKPLPDAQPWPLPYSFSRNIKENVPIVDEVPSPEAELPIQNNNRRRRNRRQRAQSNRNSNNRSNNRNANTLEGPPLIAIPEDQPLDENSNIREDVKFENNDSLQTFSSNETILVPYQSCNESETMEDVEDFDRDFDSEDWEFLDSGFMNEEPQSFIAQETYDAYASNTAVNSFTQCNTVFQAEDGSTKVTTVYSNYIETTFKSPSESSNTVQYQAAPAPYPYPNQFCTQPCCLPVPTYQQQVPHYQMPEYQPPLPPMPEYQPPLPPMPEYQPQASQYQSDVPPYQYPPDVSSYQYQSDVPQYQSPMYQHQMPEYPPMPENQRPMIEYKSQATDYQFPPHPITEYQPQTVDNQPPMLDYQPQAEHAANYQYYSENQMQVAAITNYPYQPVSASTNYGDYKGYYPTPIPVVSIALPRGMQPVSAFYTCPCMTNCYNYPSYAVPMSQNIQQPIVPQVKWPAPAELPPSNMLAIEYKPNA